MNIEDYVIHDEFGEAINSLGTYKTIADLIRDGKSCIVGWTDQEGTHLDILFTYGASHIGGMLQGGVRSTDLFVSVMRIGTFGFEIDRLDTHPSYFGEKLKLGKNVTTEKLADLINGVKGELL